MIKIVIVDNIETMVNGYASLLEKSNSNYSVVGKFTKVTNAFHFIKKNEIDLLITDIVFPDSEINNLVSFIKSTKNRQPNCKILGVTESAGINEIQQVILGGANTIHIKDCDKSFLKAIKNILEGRIEEEIIEIKKEGRRTRPTLKEREIEILEVIHFSNKQIASGLGLLSHKAAEGRILRLCKKMDINRTELYGWWQENRHWYIDKTKIT